MQLIKFISKISIIFNVIFLSLPSFAQEFDEKINIVDYVRYINNTPALNDARKLLDEINLPEAKHVSVPISALIDLRIFELDKAYLGIHNASLEWFNYIYSDKNSAIQTIENFFKIKRLPFTFELAGVISLAVITHNNQDYLKSIRYINQWHSYRATKRHQLYYLLADNYLKIGDLKNAFLNYKIAVEIWEGYKRSGQDMRDEMGIENYSDMVSDLNFRFENNGDIDLFENNITVDIPPLTDDFWIVKPYAIFPKAAIKKGNYGYTDAIFDVTRNGNPKNITFGDVSNSLFKRNAIKFLGNMKYIQYDIPGKNKYIAKGVKYRIEFNYEK